MGKGSYPEFSNDDDDDDDVEDLLPKNLKNLWTWMSL